MQHIRYRHYAMRILSDNSKTLLLCVTRKRTCYGDDRTSGACFLDEITMRNNLREWRRGECFAVVRHEIVPGFLCTPYVLCGKISSSWFSTSVFGGEVPFRFWIDVGL